jgi:hypothetical protein
MAIGQGDRVFEHRMILFGHESGDGKPAIGLGMKLDNPITMFAGRWKNRQN